MDINETKQLMNALSRLGGKDNIYELEHRLERDEEDELLEVMSKPVSIQMWSRFYAREKNYATSSYDINKRRYKGRDEDALETYRLEGLRKITEETDPLKKLDIFYECARELQDSIKMLDFLEYVSSETRTLVSIDVCSNMFDAGKYTLTEINANLPWLQISDIYGLSKMLEKDIPITEEELEVVKAEYHKSGKPTVLKKLFGEPENIKKSLKELLSGENDG